MGVHSHANGTLAGFSRTGLTEILDVLLSSGSSSRRAGG